MWSKHYLALVCLFLNVYMSICAQSHLVFSSIDTKNGLSENRIRNIQQLEDGRMVITTEGVTNIYDGTSFKHIHLKGSDWMPLTRYAGFHHGYVDNDRFWMKYRGKLMFMDVKSERFISHPDSVLALVGIREAIADFFVDADKNYWILTSNDQLLLKKAGEIFCGVFLNNVSVKSGFPDELYDVAVAQGQVFLCYRSGLMEVFDLKSKRQLYKTQPFSVSKPHQYESTLMVVSSNGVLYQIRNGEGGIMLAYNIDQQKWETILQTNYWLNTLTVDNSGNLWVSCQKGLWFIGKGIASKEFISSFKLLDGTEISTEISTQYHDSQGGLWIGTFKHGLLYYHDERFKFMNFGISDFDQSIKNIDVTAFSNNKTHGILVGTSNGLYQYSLKTNRLSSLPGFPTNLTCSSLFSDSQDRVWICTESHGLYCLNKEGIQHFGSQYGMLTQLCEAPNDQFFAATNHGFGIFNVNTGSVDYLHFKGPVSQLILLGDETLLGKEDSGLFVYDYKKKQFSQFLNTQLQTGNQQFNCLFEDRVGRIWIGTQDGLSLWQPQTGELQTLYTDDGLVNNSIKGIAEDLQGCIWVTTSGGVSRIVVTYNNNKLQFSFTNFNHLDGLIGNEFVARSVFITSNETLFMGGVNGFNVIDLRKEWRNSQLPKPLFTNLQLFGTSIKQGQRYNGNTILKNSIATTHYIELDHNQNFIGVGFSAMNYVNPTLTYFRYQLLGVDDDWREVVSKNGTGVTSYTNLSQGTYRLNVESATNSKQWTGNVAHLIIVVKAPIWKKPIAYIAYLMFVVLIGFLVVGFYKRRAYHRWVRKNEEKLNQLKFNFFTNVSHEFRTPLTLIITPLESIINEVKDEVLAAKLRGIFRHARDLQGLVNQLLDFRRLEMNGEKLNLTFGNMVEFVKQFEGIFGKLALEKQIIFVVNADLVDAFIYFDQLKLYRILNNLLSNAFKFTLAKGSVSLKLSVVQDDAQHSFVQIEVVDTGRGISEDELPKIFNRFYQTPGANEGSGIGLHLVKEYVLLHSGSIMVRSELGSGTCFTLRIPMNLKPNNSGAYSLVATDEEKIEFPSSASLNKQYRLLVVEDNDDLRRFIVAELSKRYSIIEASDGLIGKELARRELPDLIVSDVMMPNLSGIELCQSIKSNRDTSHIPVILLTARSSDEHRLLGYKAGADEYLPKPFRLDVLLLRIDKLIEQQNLRKKRFAQKIEVNPQEITITSFDEKLIEKALKCIEANMDNAEYSVQLFSEDLSMDRTVLYKKLQSITGLAPSEFIRSIRLKRAAQLLLKSQLPVSEIADKVGFNTHRYFSKYFKESYGVAPSEYVKKMSNSL